MPQPATSQIAKAFNGFLDMNSATSRSDSPQLRTSTSTATRRIFARHLRRADSRMRCYRRLRHVGQVSTILYARQPIRSDRLKSRRNTRGPPTRCIEAIRALLGARCNSCRSDSLVKISRRRGPAIGEPLRAAAIGDHFLQPGSGTFRWARRPINWGRRRCDYAHAADPERGLSGHRAGIRTLLPRPVDSS